MPFGGWRKCGCDPLRNETINKTVYPPGSRYRQQMEKNCTGVCNAVMTKSYDLAQFVRGAAWRTGRVITCPYVYGPFDCGVRSLTMLWDITESIHLSWRYLQQLVMTRMFRCLFKGISCALLLMPISATFHLFFSTHRFPF